MIEDFKKMADLFREMALAANGTEEEQALCLGKLILVQGKFAEMEG